MVLIIGYNDNYYIEYDPYTNLFVNKEKEQFASFCKKLENIANSYKEYFKGLLMI